MPFDLCCVWPISHCLWAKCCSCFLKIDSFSSFLLMMFRMIISCLFYFKNSFLSCLCWMNFTLLLNSVSYFALSCYSFASYSRCLRSFTSKASFCCLSYSCIFCFTRSSSNSKRLIRFWRCSTYLSLSILCTFAAKDFGDTYSWFVYCLWKVLVGGETPNPADILWVFDKLIWCLLCPPSTYKVAPPKLLLSSIFRGELLLLNSLLPLPYAVL